MPQEGYPNLIGPGDRTPEEVREQTRKGGQASGAARRRRKTFAEGLRQLLQMEETDPEARALLQSLGLDGTVQDSLNMAQVRQAYKGDSDAFRLIRDTVGEKPREGLEIGNLDGRPLATMDLRSLSNEQLEALISAREDV